MRSDSPALTYSRLQRNGSLLALFDRVEDVLHAHAVPKQDRYEAMLHLLLAKLYDERVHAEDRDAPLHIQDAAAVGLSVSEVKQRFDALLRRVVEHYGTALQRPLADTLSVSAATLADALAVLAPMRIGGASRSAMQDFFMRFAKDLYKWDMAQYFTPTPITEFVVEAVDPRSEDLVTDPALGSGDFLIAAWDRDYGEPLLKPKLFGVDISSTAAHVAELNKILHNALSCRIRVADSLAEIDGPLQEADGYTCTRLHHVVMCNPPFGRRIRMQDHEILQRFDLGHHWTLDADGRWERGDTLGSQETGILFLEACVRMAIPGIGRVAIVVPNGYLGNRGREYLFLREWLLRHTLVVAVLSFPRFTFKGSGADVSASVLLLERRARPLASSRDAEDHPVAVELVERVGWHVGTKNGRPTYLREADGTMARDDDGEPVLDAEFAAVLARLRTSAAGERFGWLAGHTRVPAGSPPGHTVPARTILDDPQLCLDPKRHSAKYLGVRADITARSHFRLGDVAVVVAELSAAEVRRRDPSAAFRYVEIADVGPGMYSAAEVPGWRLPSRARHGAVSGDLFVGGIWGSVTKWFVAGEEDNLVVTNGFRRLRVDPDALLDVMVGLCSEAFAVQMRALALGSDGLAEVSEEDVLDVALPCITDRRMRTDLEPLVGLLLRAQSSLKARVDGLIRAGALPFPDVPPRPSHVVLV